MITIICGIPGSGKTALLTKFAVDKMVEENYDYYFNATNEIKELQKGGFTSLQLLPQMHTVYADYLIKCQFPYATNYYVDGFRLAMENRFFETAFVCPYAQIFLDEAQRYYDSRRSKDIRDCVYNFYQLHRHDDIDIYMACQRLENIDLNIRSIAECIIYIDKLEMQKDEFDRVLAMKWSVLEFSCLAHAEAFISSGKTDNAIRKEYTFDGCIFDYYNSKEKRPLFYLNKLYRSYDVFTDDGDYKFTVEDYARYSGLYTFVAPSGYWKNEKIDIKLTKGA